MNSRPIKSNLQDSKDQGHLRLFFAKSIAKELLLILVLGFASLFWLSLISYSPTDGSWISVTYPEVPTQNLSGIFGAYISGICIYLWGVLSWGLPIPIMIWAWKCWQNNNFSLRYSQVSGVCLLYLCITLIITWLRPSVTINEYILPSSGIIGAVLNDLVKLYCGKMGGYLALITWMSIALILLLQVNILSLFSSKFKGYFGQLFNKKSTPIAPFESQSQRCDVPLSDPFNLKKADVPAVNPSVVPTIIPAIIPSVIPSVIPSKSDAPSISSEFNEEFQGQQGGMEMNVRGALNEPYQPPPLSVFLKSDKESGLEQKLRLEEIDSTSRLLVKTLEDFGIYGQIIGHQSGPVVTVYEYQIEAGVKQAKVQTLVDDLALALKVDSLFIQPVRGKSALGIQVPNTIREPVYLGDILNTKSFAEAKSPLTFGLGKAINGDPISTDLCAMPHLLVAGATGSGKSVGVNAMLCSIIRKATPEQVRMILVDPKMLELSVYEGIPHLLMPVITDPSKASLALKWATHEMERRYKLMQLCSVRSIEGFNEFWMRTSDEKRQHIRDAMNEENIPGAKSRNHSINTLPYIMLVIDELADLMMTAPKDVEIHIQRLAQKARASGIHMVLATQRPSVDIITGVIKANLPCRIAYQVVSKHDSRTILDIIGAEKLLGKGDLLFQKPGVSRLERIQGALITDDEVLNLVASVKATGQGPDYNEQMIQWIDDQHASMNDSVDTYNSSNPDTDDDPKMQEAINIARMQGSISASFLQRQLKIGYNRAARMVECMDKQGLVEKADGAKPRRWIQAIKDI